jgi:hypothetical protein
MGLTTLERLSDATTLTLAGLGNTLSIAQAIAKIYTCVPFAAEVKQVSRPIYILYVSVRCTDLKDIWRGCDVL